MFHLLYLSLFLAVPGTVAFQFLSQHSLSVGRDELPLLPVVTTTNQTLPADFHAATHWPGCASISEIYDQG